MTIEDPVLSLFLDAAEGRKWLLGQRRSRSLELPAAVLAGIRRVFGKELTADEVAARILTDVRKSGDEAVLEYTRLLDGVALEKLAVGNADMEEGWRAVPPSVREALQVAAERVRRFHEQQPVHSWMEWEEEGGAWGQMVRPVKCAGVYVPGGRAPYPSSLLMAVVPARVAGVKQIVVSTPPRADGTISPVILAAAFVTQVDELFMIGGAQAIAAMAYGTESVPQADKIVGPGNVFVIAAKRQVFGEVGIDHLPGPTETMLIADDEADAAWVAADLLAQAEHDPQASAVLLTTSPDLALAVRDRMETQRETLARRDVIGQALKSHGAVIVVQSLSEAVELANEYAPEHLCLLTRNPWALVGEVENAGGVFVGEYSSEALGDYVVGPSHIMPTNGTARFNSPVNVWDFVKITSVFAPGAAESRCLSPSGITLAEAEGLTGHAAAMEKRLASGKQCGAS